MSKTCSSGTSALILSPSPVGNCSASLSNSASIQSSSVNSSRPSRSLLKLAGRGVQLNACNESSALSTLIPPSYGYGG